MVIDLLFVCGVMSSGEKIARESLKIPKSAFLQVLGPPVCLYSIHQRSAPQSPSFSCEAIGSGAGGKLAAVQRATSGLLASAST